MQLHYPPVFYIPRMTTVLTSYAAEKGRVSTFESCGYRKQLGMYKNRLHFLKSVKEQSSA